jgi:capsule biosynthesis phosphatase
MNIFIDLDNTLCITDNSDYINSIPIQERIDKINKLKDEGNSVTIWTARGSKSGINYYDLTIEQLKKWNIKYDTLLMKKPSYDLYIDDKSHNVDEFWKIPKKKKQS